jgi:hypothetical protein
MNAPPMFASFLLPHLPSTPPFTYIAIDILTVSFDLKHPFALFTHLKKQQLILLKHEGTRKKFCHKPIIIFP